MKCCSRFGPCLITLAVVAGCASTKVSGRQILVTGRVPRPDRILVYEGRAKAAAKEIADVLKTRFQQQGWIE
jgi:hypothetical protein